MLKKYATLLFVGQRTQRKPEPPSRCCYAYSIWNAIDFTGGLSGAGRNHSIHRTYMKSTGGRGNTIIIIISIIISLSALQLKLYYYLLLQQCI